VATVLAPLVQKRSPNQSSRHGQRIDLIVWHETAGAYRGAVSWLCDPRSDASAHLVVREDGREVTQLVPLANKAWHAAAFNPMSVGVEHANVTAKGYATEDELRESARIFAWLCWHLGIPARWAPNGKGRGVVRHLELGTLGGGHTSCGPFDDGWRHFLALLAEETHRGGFRKTWAL
jgi:N-acetylmuramoyl-L-alanine amidase CwlA